jgi:N-sulfoglucosamine sulfohydrolase
MFKRVIPTIFVVLLAIGFLDCSHADGFADDREPLNVLLITADDLNYDSVGCYGCEIPNITPNIDRLATEGRLFNHGYVNIAVCQPCRQSIMTGRYPHNNGAPGFDPISPEVPTLQEELNAAGYLNAILGKEKHLQPMERYCWDYCKTEGDLCSGLGIGRDPELYYQFTAEFLAKAKEEGKPFFLMANSHDPYRPFAGSDQELRAWGRDLPKFTREITTDDVTVPDFLFDLPEVRLEIAEYYTSVHRCDQSVGAVLKALDESEYRENTLVLFISDNGISVPFAKSNCYLNSNKTPWIIRWPDHVQPGGVDNEHFVSGIDYMPTILQAIGLPETPGMDGRSFLPLINDEQQEQREVVFTEFHKIFARIEYPMRSVQDATYGYIVNFWADGEKQIRGDALSGRTFQAMREAAASNDTMAERMDLFQHRVPEELYDYSVDPDGLVNLIDNPDLQQEIQRLKELLHAEMQRTDDPLLRDFENEFVK